MKGRSSGYKALVGAAMPYGHQTFDPKSSLVRSYPLRRQMGNPANIPGSPAIWLSRLPYILQPKYL